MIKKRRIITAAVAASAALLLMIGVTTAYFTDVEIKDNIITIGNVSIDLTEGTFDTSSPYAVVPGTIVDKAPKITNNGNKDEFVFIKVKVPKKNVTLLNTSGAVEKDKSWQELFRFIADSSPKENVSGRLSDSNVQGTINVINTETSDVDFYFHNGTTTSADSGIDGWILIKAAAKSETPAGSTETEYWDEYVFGYNQKLHESGETKTLFDKVQLKSFIDNEFKGDTDITVYGYGIQADNLKFDSVSVELTQEYFSLADLQNIYKIVENKANAKNNH